MTMTHTAVASGMAYSAEGFDVSLYCSLETIKYVRLQVLKNHYGKR